VLVGPTAVGKTAVGMALAAHWPVEIISADSRQV
jgi:tRNA dimethylallyltransferase